MATIRRNLLTLKAKSYVRKKKPLITPTMAKKRLAWCKKYKDKDLAYWQKVIFSDETMISINANSLMQKHRRFPWQSPLDPRFIKPTVKYPLSIMVWGCFSLNYRPDLYIVRGNMNSASYKVVLEENINNAYVKNNGYIFQMTLPPAIDQPL